VIVNRDVCPNVANAVILDATAMSDSRHRRWRAIARAIIVALGVLAPMGGSVTFGARAHETEGS
jgi:hypothetical protein